MNLFKKIANIFLAGLLLLATSGVTLSKHYCMGRLKSIAVFEQAKACFDQEEKESMPCCEDVSEELRVENLTKTSVDFDCSTQLVATLITLPTFDHLFVSYIQEEFTQNNYSPPLPSRDIPVLMQSFLI